MVDIAVIIVNWKAREDLRRCLESLFDSLSPARTWEVWVVDNNSDDGSADMVASTFPHVKLVRNPENVGFSRANNQAILASQSRYVFLLNSDAFVHSPGTGACGGQIETDEAEKNSGVAAIQGRKETIRKMTHEIGRRGKSRHDERGGSGQEANQDQQTADQFKAAADIEQPSQHRFGGRQIGEPQNFPRAVFKKRKAGDDPQNGVQPRSP